jgi:hypothetical protein
MRLPRFAIFAGLLLTLHVPIPTHGALVVDQRWTDLQVSTQWGFIGGIQTDRYHLERSSPTTDLQTMISDSKRGEAYFKPAKT